MTYPSDPAAPDDGRLMAWLAEMLRESDPPPPAVLELARQSFTLRALDAELAALVEDSDAPAGDRPAVAVRTAGVTPDRRQLTFHFHDERTGNDLVIAVEVEVRDQRRRITGHLDPAGPALVEIRQPAVPRARRVDVDRRGRFAIDEVLPGPASLTCRRVGAPSVTTEWTIV
ncbi:MAG TPA: hypothetical protein VFR35_01420 [Actinoplanes sp.]|nr:hypothetical protein [Actinoplanes sp.]